MNAKTACLCIIALSLVSIDVSTQVQAVAASGTPIAGSSPTSETHETTKPAKPGTANRNEAAREMPPVGRRGRDRCRVIELRKLKSGCNLDR